MVIWGPLLFRVLCDAFTAVVTYRFLLHCTVLDGDHVICLIGYRGGLSLFSLVCWQLGVPHLYHPTRLPYSRQGASIKKERHEFPCSPFLEQELRTLPDADKHLRTFLQL